MSAINAERFYRKEYTKETLPDTHKIEMSSVGSGTNV